MFLLINRKDYARGFWIILIIILISLFIEFVIKPEYKCKSFQTISRRIEMISEQVVYFVVNEIGNKTEILAGPFFNYHAAFYSEGYSRNNQYPYVIIREATIPITWKEE